MPTRHIVKVYAPDHYYHVFNRGWNLGKIFLDESDYDYFEMLLARHVSVKPVVGSNGKQFRHLYNDVHLNAYCLMGNHFHLLLYQYQADGVTQLMKSVLTAYTMYFNRKYKRRGPLFESTFKAVLIMDDRQLMHITRYIHLNHRRYKTWSHSSYLSYLRPPACEWIDSSPILELFASKEQYEDFVDDYKDIQRERDEIKQELFGMSR